MQNIFNITSITPNYSNKQIVIQTNFRVNKESVNKRNVVVLSAESGNAVIYKLSVDEDKIIITFKEWPQLDVCYVVKVDRIKDMLNRELVHPLSKDIYFNLETKLKCIIDSPKNNEAVKEQHQLIYFSIKQVNEDGSLTSNPMPDCHCPELPNEDNNNNNNNNNNGNNNDENNNNNNNNNDTNNNNNNNGNNDNIIPSNLTKEAVSEEESDIMYHFEFASDIAFFDIVKDYTSNYTDGHITLENNQYFMRARVIKDNLAGDWSDTITFTVIPDSCTDIQELEQAKQDYLDEIFAPVDFFINGEDKILEIVSCSENGVTYPEFYIEFNKDLDIKKLPKNIMAYRRDL